jgi:hypothetical protein
VEEVYNEQRLERGELRKGWMQRMKELNYKTETVLTSMTNGPPNTHSPVCVCVSAVIHSLFFFISFGYVLPERLRLILTCFFFIYLPISKVLKMEHYRLQYIFFFEPANICDLFNFFFQK